MDAAARHAREHANSVMPGRTWLQQATPITFGLKAAGWVDALDRVTSGMRSAFDSACVLQLGGASGTLAALGDRGPAVAKHMARSLGLGLPPMPWHAHRDRLATLSCALAVATGTLGKIARDVALLAQTEVAEVHEGTTEGVSSTMPQKQNPVHCAIALASAVRAPGLAATMLAAMVQEHERALGGWQAEWDTLPELVIVTADAAEATAAALETLVVDPARMRANLDESGGLVLAEAVAVRLAARVGKARAHQIVEQAVRRSSSERRPFAEVLAAEPQIAAVLDRREIEDALSADQYLGSASTFIANVLARVSKE
jgi:3-carboxy-cis,cis-muconate cycloisomerase